MLIYELGQKFSTRYRFWLLELKSHLLNQVLDMPNSKQLWNLKLSLLHHIPRRYLHENNYTLLVWSNMSTKVLLWWKSCIHCNLNQYRLILSIFKGAQALITVATYFLKRVYCKIISLFIHLPHPLVTFC